MNENVLSLVMDTIGIVGMVFVAGVLCARFCAPMQNRLTK